jgi:mono/diheme cytochrome c family protein
LLAVPALITGWITGNDLKLTGAAAPPAIFVRHRLAAFTTAGLAIILLLWRVKARDQLPRNAHLASVALALVTAGVVGFTGYLGGRMVFGEAAPKTAQNSGYVPVAPGEKLPNVSPQLVAAGQKLFAELPCQSCHRMEGKGGIAGPDLTHEARRHADVDWHIRHLKDPTILKADADMPPFDDLSPAELKALASYLATRK